MKFFKSVWAQFLVVGLAASCWGSSAEDTLNVVAYGSASGMSAPKKGLVGVWNLKSNGQNKGDDHRSVAVWFHGGMTSGNCEKGLVAGGDMAELLPGFIVMSASACKQDHWVTPVAVGWVDAALDSIAGRRGYPIDNIYLVGISDGALGVMAYSLWGRRQVKSRLLISSYGAAFGDAAEIARERRLQTGRWRFIQGGSDRLYPADVTVPWITRFCNSLDQGSEANSSLQCDMKFDPAGEHDWSYWKSHQKDWILEIFNEK